MRIAMLAPIAWRTPPEHYGPWEQVVGTLTEALLDLDVDVGLYATGDSRTRGELFSVVAHGYETDRSYDVKVFEGLHIAQCFEHARAGRYDLVHNHADFLPLAWSRMIDVPVVTTIHGFSSAAILPAFQRYDDRVDYVAISESDRHPALTYSATIHHGIDLALFPFRPTADADGHLLFFGRIHPDKGTHLAIDIAEAAGRPLRIAGIIHDQAYFDGMVRPRLGPTVEFVGPIGGADRAAALGGATALLHPIEFDEPFGLSVVEALACGTPTIAIARGSMPEIIRHGETGFLVPDATAAVGLVAAAPGLDRGLCRRDAEERFSARRMAVDYRELYARLLGEQQ
jgi:glycosyltransferase involved in cell wall biosynthesis